MKRLQPSPRCFENLPVIRNCQMSHQMESTSLELVEAARKEYPGYLKLYPELYARGWDEVK